MRHIFRTLITIVATLAVVFSGVAFAQEGEPVAECEARGGEWFDWGPGAPHGCSLDHPYEYGKVLELRDLVAQADECEAAGGEYHHGRNPLGEPTPGCVLPGGEVVDYEFVEYSAAAEPEPVTEPEPVEPAQVESATAEPAPSAPLPATEPTPATPRAPQYTG